MRKQFVVRAVTLSVLIVVGFAVQASRGVMSTEELLAQAAPPALPPEQVPSGPQRPPYKPDRPVAIVGGLLIDATGAPPRHDMTVITKDDRIVEIGPMDQVKPPPGAMVIDAAGMTIMPGLIDSNQHIVLNPMYSTPDVGLSLDEFRKRWEGNWARAERMAWVYLMQGITSFRQTPGPADVELKIKKRIEAGEIAGSRIFLGGSLWMSKAHWERHLKQHNQTDPAAIEFIKHKFEYNVIEDLKNLDPNGWGQEGPDFNFWKLYMSDEPFDGVNDFTDAELRSIIEQGAQPRQDHRCARRRPQRRPAPHARLRRRHARASVLRRRAHRHGTSSRATSKKGVIVDTLLQVMIDAAERAADPQRFERNALHRCRWTRRSTGS